MAVIIYTCVYIMTKIPFSNVILHIKAKVISKGPSIEKKKSILVG